MEKAVVKKSRIQGTGVFAAAQFRRGQKIFKFSGKIIRINHRPGCHCKVCRRCIQVGRDAWLYPRRGSLGWNLNHSCEPSCGFCKSWIVALRRIGAGEEVTIDYSTTNTDTEWRMECTCGRKGCRKEIRSVQRLPPKLFGGFSGLMPRYVEKEYRKTHGIEKNKKRKNKEK
jgi:hypothetical protein